MKQLLFINQTLGIGGAETFNTDLLEWLSEQSIVINAYSNNSQFIKLLSHKNISVGKVPFVMDVIGNWRGLIKGVLLFPAGVFFYGYLLIKHKDASVILMTGFIEKIIVTPMAKLFNIPVVWIEFGPLKSVFDKFFGLPGVLYRLVSRLPEKVIMSSQHTHVSNKNITGIPEKIVKVIPCAVKVLDPKLKPDNNYVICVSRLEKGKGQDLLIKSWAEVILRVPSARLKIIGQGDQLIKLKQMVHNLQLQESVQVLGWVEDSISELSRSGIAVFPSMWPLEGFGIVAVEALAVARPVVIFNRGPLPEIIDKNCGMIVPPGDIKKMSEAIIYLLKHPNIIRKMGDAGKEKYNKQFTWRTLGPVYLKNLLLS